MRHLWAPVSPAELGDLLVKSLLGLAEAAEGLAPLGVGKHVVAELARLAEQRQHLRRRGTALSPVWSAVLWPCRSPRIAGMTQTSPQTSPHVMSETSLRRCAVNSRARMNAGKHEG